MTSHHLVQSVEEGDAHRFSSMSEGYVYLYLRFHADRRGVVRLSMTELAGMLNVNRQTILKHIETLTAKQLVSREGHGRYRVFAEPWSVENIARTYVASLPPGAEFDIRQVGILAYGEVNDLDWNSGDDQRVRELDGVEYRLEASGLLSTDDDGTLRKPRATARR